MYIYVYVYVYVYIYVYIYIGKYNPQSSTNRGIEHCSIRGFQSHGGSPVVAIGLNHQKMWIFKSSSYLFEGFQSPKK